MSEKKVFGRRIAILLGISCIVLVVALVSVVSEAYRLRNIVDLRESRIWLDHHYFILEGNAETDLYYSADYAGYVTVQLESASPSIYIEVSYFAYGVSYDRRVNPGVDGNVTFPILPASVKIAVGSLNAGNQATARITVTYFY